MVPRDIPVITLKRVSLVRDNNLFKCENVQAEYAKNMQIFFFYKSDIKSQFLLCCVYTLFNVTKNNCLYCRILQNFAGSLQAQDQKNHGGNFAVNFDLLTK
jgi:hypothetical protein